MKVILLSLVVALIFSIGEAGYISNGWNGYGSGWGGYGNGWNGYRSGWNGYRSGWNGYGGSWNPWRSGGTVKVIRISSGNGGYGGYSSHGWW